MVNCVRTEVINDFEDDIDIVAFRARSANRAMDAYEEEILGRDVFSSSEAQALGALYAVSFAEVLVHGTDLNHFIHMKHHGLESHTSPKSFEFSYDARIRFEVAIHSALQGEYRVLKEALLWRAQYLQNLYGKNNHARNLAEKLNILVHAMGDIGDKLKMPLIPAWRDERFNNDAADSA